MSNEGERRNSGLLGNITDVDNIHVGQAYDIVTVEISAHEKQFVRRDPNTGAYVDERGLGLTQDNQGRYMRRESYAD